MGILDTSHDKQYFNTIIDTINHINDIINDIIKGIDKSINDLELFATSQTKWIELRDENHLHWLHSNVKNKISFRCLTFTATENGH